MKERIDHTAKALQMEEMANDIVDAVPMDASEAASIKLGKAQVHATLALVEQQRIANLIAVASAETMDVSRKWYPAMPITYEHMRQEIAAALGIETGENDE